MPLAVATYASAAEAARAAAARGAHIMGGGTVLMRLVNEAAAEVGTLVRVTDPALRAVRTEPGVVVVGAQVTMAEILAHRDLAVLAPAARLIGGPQVREAATVGGNLFAPAPYGDLAAALLALDAEAMTADGRRTRIDELRPGVLVVAVRVPTGRALHFAKVTRVKPKGVSVLSIAAVLPNRGGRLEGVRVAFNGMGERPLRAPGVERELEGRPLDAAAVARAARAAAELRPRDDALASAWYRREVAGVHLKRLLEGAAR